MNTKVLIPLFTIIIGLIIADIVYHSNKQKRLNKIFALFNLLIVYWMFTLEFMYYQGNNINTTYAWAKIGSFWFFSIPAFVHFILVFTEEKKLLNNKFIYVFLYFPAFIFSVLTLTTNFLTGNPELYYSGNAPAILIKTSLFYQIFIIWSLLSAFSALFLLIRFYFINKDKTKKNQTKYIFIGLFIVFLIAIGEVTLPLLGIKYQKIDSVSTTLLNICIGYAIWKYDLFQVDPMKAAENIIATMPGSLILTDLDNKIVEVNPSFIKLFGHQEEEVIGKSMGILFTNVEIINTIMDELLSGKEIFDLETELVAKAGSIIPVLFYGSVIKNKTGQKIGMVCIIRDITDRKKSEKELLSFNNKLQQSNRALQEFAFIASHDLQEPLRKINSYCERLQYKYQTVIDGKGSEYMEKMQNAAVRMQTLINDLLTYSRVTTHAEPYTSVDLFQIVKEVLTDLEVQIEKTAGRVELSLLPVINADPTQMRQLFQNLIGNSLKFHKPGEPPAVKIYAAKEVPDGYCSIVIEDNGIGIDEIYYDKIFGVFQRLHGKSEYEGSGIGLAVCKKIAEKHGGTIRVESKPGVGTKFIVNLPLRMII